MKDSAKEPTIKKMTDDEKLQLYALYKQAKEGDVNDKDKPSTFSLNFEAKAKHGAREKVKGKSHDQAKAEYIAYANTLFEKYGVKQYIVS